MPLTYPARSQVGQGVVATLSGAGIPTDSSNTTVGDTFTVSTSITTWLDISLAGFTNPVELIIDQAGTPEKIEATVVLATGTFTIVRRMIDVPGGPTGGNPAPAHTAGVTVQPVWTAEQAAELGSLIQIVKPILLSDGVATAPGPVDYGTGSPIPGSAPLFAALDHGHYMGADQFEDGLSGASGSVSWASVAGGSNLSMGQGGAVSSTGTITIVPGEATTGLVGVQADYAATNGSPVTISCSGYTFAGIGVPSGASSLVLGAPGAFVVLALVGSVFYVVGGAADTGWIAFSYSNSYASNSGPVGATAAGYRRVGDLVVLGGSVKTGTTGNAFATLPSGFRPTYQTGFCIPTNVAAADSGTLLVSTAGVCTPYFSAGATPVLDGVSFRVD